MIRKMGPLTSLLGMIPGLAGHQLQNMKVDERELDRIQAIILSMTPEERRRPELIKGSRRLRIARGSGTNVQQVNRLVKQFGQMRKVMRQVGRGKMPDIGALMRRRPLMRRGPGGLGGLRCPHRLSSATFEESSREEIVAVRLRLTRVGGKKDPIWRVVVADQRSPRDGRVIETIGHYNAQTDPSTIVIDEERARSWLARGAQPSNTVRKLLRIQGIETRTG